MEYENVSKPAPVLDLAGPEDPVEHAKLLVTRLYDPHYAGAGAVTVIQWRLQQLQKSPDGWKIASSLLESPDEQARFMGALTYTVKINQDWDRLSQKEVDELLVTLVNHFIKSVRNGHSRLVIRKLCSTLVSLFIRPNVPWMKCVRNLAISVTNLQFIDEKSCEAYKLATDVLPRANGSTLLPILFFSTTLGEEAMRIPQNVRDRIRGNLYDAFAIADFVLRAIVHRPEGSPTDPEMMEIGNEAVKSFYVWHGAIPFIKADPIPSSTYEAQTSLVVLSLTVPYLAGSAMEAVADILQNQSASLTENHKANILAFLTSPRGEEYAQSLLHGDFGEENMRYVNMVLAYLDLVQKTLFTADETNPNRKLLVLLHKLFECPDNEDANNQVGTLLLEFWTEAAESLNDAVDEEEEEATPPDFPFANDELGKVIVDCYPKILYPAAEILRDWDDDDKIRFNSFRRDFAEYLLAVYPVLGVELFRELQHRAETTLSGQDWHGFEAYAFCLAHLAEAVAENQHADDSLSRLFYSEEFSYLCLSQDVQIPTKTRQTLVDLLGKYTSFFERNKSLLPQVLTFLFFSLSIESCTTVASKSISTLCRSCRQFLTVELDAFITQFEIFRGTPVATSSAMERVLDGVAAIINALNDDRRKVAYLTRLLNDLHHQATLARTEGLQDVDSAHERGVTVLRCVASMGRGFRAPDDTVIDLDQKGIPGPSTPTFWNSGEGAEPQRLVLDILVGLTENMGLDAEIVEAVCDVLKSGLTEHSPGPFVLPPNVVVHFLTRSRVGTPRVDAFMGTASAFLASHAHHGAEIRGEVVTLLQHVYNLFCHMLRFPERNDPEVSYSGIDFLTRLVPKYGTLFFSVNSIPPPAPYENDDPAAPRPPVLSTLLDFTLLALQGSETLPLRSAASFWSTLLGLDLDSVAKGTDATALIASHYVPALCPILIRQIAGGCARSDIDHLAEILKALVFKWQKEAKPHLSNELNSLAVSPKPGDPQQTVLASAQEGQRFLAKVVYLKNKRATNKAVRDFWLECRGQDFSYAR